ncbi:phage antirepressor KilAC domain-containing protein [Streptomyces sp. NPDC059517]|uniref:phage antirepressor KilAC domain-containing protein n=1 Tax=Streptomyces sp. NPDC059517 TaxID=3346855 RepID=UPI0036AC216A
MELEVSSWHGFSALDGDYCVADSTRFLSRDNCIAVGRDRLLAELLAMRWAYRQQADGRPPAMQTAVDRGWRAELTQSPTETGDTILDPQQVRIAAKGLHDLHRRLGGGSALAITS